MTAIPTIPTTSPKRLPALGAQILGWLGSMKLAVWLLVALTLLTWLGTLAQTSRSTYDVQREYFESWFVIAELPLSVWNIGWFPDAQGVPWTLRIPLPGAFPVMALLCLNLIVGGFVRIKWHRRNSGILVTHGGILLLLISGFVKLNYSHSGMLGVFEWPQDGNQHPDRLYETSRFVNSNDDELALLIDRGDSIEERVIPEQQLWAARGDGSVTLAAEGLPFQVQIRHWIDHAQALPKGPMVKTLKPVVDGVFLRALQWPQGEQPRSEHEFSGCYVTILGQEQERSEGVLLSGRLAPFDKARYPFTFTVKGQRYGLELRRVTRDLPFSLRLDKFQKRDHPGTLSPMDFRSFVQATDSTGSQEAQVFMNNPLRRDGYVVYQSGWGPQVNGVPRGGPPWYSEFEVSYNPSDIWPMLACFVIFAGLALHFLMKLSRFLKSSTRTSLHA